MGKFDEFFDTESGGEIQKEKKCELTNTNKGKILKYMKE